jgi:hypothetical protein
MCDVMATFGDAAIRATELVRDRQFRSPRDAWKRAVAELFPDSVSMREKGCPRAAFLGLCEEGLVAGIAHGTYTSSQENKADAVKAAALLARDPALASRGPKALWDHVLAGRTKRHNAQMDIVLALFGKGLLSLQGA